MVSTSRMSNNKTFRSINMQEDPAAMSGLFLCNGRLPVGYDIAGLCKVLSLCGDKRTKEC